jgi:hypothetical protein
VVQDVAGSSPVTHPNDKDPGIIPWVFVIEGSNMAGGTWEEVIGDDRRLPTLPSKTAILGPGITMETKTQYDRTLMLSKGESDD